MTILLIRAILVSMYRFCYPYCFMSRYAWLISHKALLLIGTIYTVATTSHLIGCRFILGSRRGVHGHHLMRRLIVRLLLYTWPEILHTLRSRCAVIITCGCITLGSRFRTGFSKRLISFVATFIMLTISSVIILFL